MALEELFLFSLECLRVLGEHRVCVTGPPLISSLAPPVLAITVSLTSPSPQIFHSSHSHLLLAYLCQSLGWEIVFYVVSHQPVLQSSCSPALWIDTDSMHSGSERPVYPSFCLTQVH